MIFDIVVLSVLLISAAIAFLRGFIREALTIIGVLGGSLAAFYLGPVLSPLIGGWMGVKDGVEPEKLFDIVPYPYVAGALAYGGTFVVVVIVLSIVSHFLSGGAKAVGLGALDRTFGVLFGIARAAVLLTLLYMPVLILVNGKTRDQWFESSHTRVYVEGASVWAMQYLPEAMKGDASAKAADATREKLKELDLLGGGENDGDAAPSPQDNPGYGDDQRREIQNLIEDKIND